MLEMRNQHENMDMWCWNYTVFVLYLSSIYLYVFMMIWNFICGVKLLGLLRIFSSVGDGIVSKPCLP